MFELRFSPKLLNATKTKGWPLQGEKQFWTLKCHFSCQTFLSALPYAIHHLHFPYYNKSYVY